MIKLKLLVSWVLPLVALLVRMADPMTDRDLRIGLAVLCCWPAGEWIVHRYLMHGPKWMPFHGSHKRHHDFPCAETGLPDWSVFAVYFVVLVLVVVFGSLDVLSLVAFVLLGLACYETVHYRVHSARPRTWLGLAIRANHFYHHRHENVCFGMLFPCSKPMGGDQ